MTQARIQNEKLGVEHRHQSVLICLLLFIFFLRKESSFKIVLFVVLYGCETISLTLREEHILWIFENRVLRIIYGRKRDEVTGGWGNLLYDMLRYS
jgi:hypothetical protein